MEIAIEIAGWLLPLGVVARSCRGRGLPWQGRYKGRLPGGSSCSNRGRPVHRRRHAPAAEGASWSGVGRVAEGGQSTQASAARHCTTLLGTARHYSVLLG